MATSNPVIRQLLVSTSAAQSPPGRGVKTGKRRRFELLPAAARERPLTVDDVVVKTGLSLAIVLAGAILTILLGLWFLGWLAALVGLGLTVYSVLRPRPLPGLTVGYSIAEGVVIGSAVRGVESLHHGVATQAVIGTAGVFVAMLVIYKTRILRLTTKVIRWAVAALLGGLILTVVNAVAFAVFDTDLGFRGGDTVSFVLTAVFIALAAFSLLLNFNAVDQMIRLGVSERWAWYLAFGLIATLVWLYLELLWLPTSLR